MIESITVSNFENLEATWQLGLVVELRGRNGSGKSAIGRAIGWCFSGLDAYGDRRTDHVMRNPAKPTTVTLKTSDGQEITRTKTLTANRLSVNGAPVDADYFGDPHLILSSWMPGYFQGLDENKKRQLFMDLLPSVDLVALFQERTGLDQKAQAALGLDFSQDPAKLHKRWASTRLDKQKELQQLKGGESELTLRVQELEKRLKEAETNQDGVDLDELERKGKELSEELQALKDQAKDHKEWEHKAALYESKLEDRKRYQEQVDKALDGMTPEELTETLEISAREMERLEETQEKHQDWENAVTSWEDAKEEFEEQLAHLDKNDCYTCQAALTDEQVKRLKEQLLDGEKEPGKEPLRVHPSDMDLAKKDLQNLKDRVSLAREYKGFLNSRPLPDEPGPEPADVDADHIADMEETLRGVRDEYTAAKASAQATIDTMNQQLEKAREDLEANASLQEEVSGQVDRLQAVEDALHPASGVFIDALAKQLESVAKLLPAWTFELSETTKTSGKAKPCFKEYLQVEHGLVPLRYCSAGQQLRAGIDLCAALDRLNGGKLGMLFCDNVELLSMEGALTVDEGVQVFKARVANSDLKVEVLVPA